MQDFDYYGTYTLNTTHWHQGLVRVPLLLDNLSTLQAVHHAMLENKALCAIENADTFQHIAIVQQAGQTLVLRPFWTATCMATQTSVSSTYHTATAMTFAKQIKNIDAIEDKAIVRGLENKYRAVWLKSLEQKRKKNASYRLQCTRLEHACWKYPTARLRQHFDDCHCLRREHSNPHG